MVCNKKTVFGHAWESSHKKGPNGNLQHPYASQATICFSKELYKNLGSPSCDHWSEQSEEFGGDTAELITYRAKKLGYVVSLVYPSHSTDPTNDLDNGCRYGMGNTYGIDLFYHASQQNRPESKELFINKCREVLDGKYE